MKYTSFISHAAAAIIITGIMLCMYATVQQTYRSSANDPQIEIARNISNSLNKNNDYLIIDSINLSQSLSVFTELFDKSGKPLKSGGFIDGKLPQLPQGVFRSAKENSEDVVTWQPESNVRLAMVIEKVNSPIVGFVAVGRSLKEVEIRESNLVKMVAIVWIACMAVLLVHLLIQVYLHKKF